MRTEEFNGHTITYPDETCFAFNPQIITIDNLTGSVIFYVGDYSDMREPISGKVSIDISEYLRSLLRFDYTTIPNSRSIHIQIDIDGPTFEFYINVIWGAMNIGEVFNPSRTVTMFRNFPSTISIYSNGEINVRYDAEEYTSVEVEKTGLLYKDFSELFKEAKEFGMIKILNTPEAPSTFQYTFDRTFKPLPDDAVLIKVLFNDCDKGIYLRWLDRHGFLQYWLFQEGDLTGQSSNEGEQLNVDYSNIKYVYNGMSRYQGKTYQTTRKACATLVERETFNMLSSIHSSPIVDMYIDENWIPVNIVVGSFTDNGADLQDFEIQITMPETITQML
ncbi:hypothetical protein ACJEEV_14570 [Bacteroides xylanisolvens]|jgi:hypothetical protein|uniref:hypothetical protein n=1 Tax=Bacteroides xylanisolvens TaxID=371601 RepID=UPI00397C0D1B